MFLLSFQAKGIALKNTKSCFPARLACCIKSRALKTKEARPVAQCHPQTDAHVICCSWGRRARGCWASALLGGWIRCRRPSRVAPGAAAAGSASCSLFSFALRASSLSCLLRAAPLGIYCVLARGDAQKAAMCPGGSGALGGSLLYKKEPGPPGAPLACPRASPPGSPAGAPAPAPPPRRQPRLSYAYFGSTGAENARFK